MWQIAEFKCSEMWSKTAAPNHLHKEGFWSFSFSSHLPGILYFLSRSSGSNVRDLWYMGIIFRASAGGTSLTAAACFLIWYNFQTLCLDSSKCTFLREKHTVFNSRSSSQKQFTLFNWMRFYASLIHTSHRELQAHSHLQRRVHSLHFFNVPWTLSREDSLPSGCAVHFT